jgi:hypothetical protein
MMMRAAALSTALMHNIVSHAVTALSSLSAMLILSSISDIRFILDWILIAADLAPC